MEYKEAAGDNRFIETRAEFLEAVLGLEINCIYFSIIFLWFFKIILWRILFLLIFNFS